MHCQCQGRNAPYFSIRASTRLKLLRHVCIIKGASARFDAIFITETGIANLCANLFCLCYL